MPSKLTPRAAKTPAKEARHAAGVDAPIKAANLLRLRRIEGQVRGLHKMVEDDRYCPDILSQVASVQEALKGVAKELVRNHLNHCARRAMKGTDAEAQSAIDELLTVWSKHT